MYCPKTIVLRNLFQLHIVSACRACGVMVWCYSLQAAYSTHLQLMVEILNKVSGSQGKGEEKFSVAKVILGSEPGIINLKWCTGSEFFCMLEVEEAYHSLNCCHDRIL